MVSTSLSEEMFELLTLAKSRAYCPYSKFHVGCVILMKSGETVLGCNVENASYSVTACAERTAIGSAIAQGYQKSDMAAFYVITNLDYPVYPCGVCRSAIAEMNREARVITVSGDGTQVKESSINTLMPHCFGESDLQESDKQSK